MSLVLATLSGVGNLFKYTGGTGVSDGDVIIQTGDVSRFDAFYLMSSTGAMEVFVCIDDIGSGTVQAPVPVYSTAPLSLVDMGATSTAPVTITAANRMYAFFGAWKLIQVKQSGGTAVTFASLSMTKKGGQY